MAEKVHFLNFVPPLPLLKILDPPQICLSLVSAHQTSIQRPTITRGMKTLKESSKSFNSVLELYKCPMEAVSCWAVLWLMRNDAKDRRISPQGAQFR